jgi:hypothetical protein
MKDCGVPISSASKHEFLAGAGSKVSEAQPYTRKRMSELEQSNVVEAVEKVSAHEMNETHRVCVVLSY